MEAKDTVTLVNEFLEEMGWVISKDGMQYAWLKHLVEISFKAGIKEVVEFINSENAIMVTKPDGCTFFLYVGREWQAKLKEWGL